MELRLSTKNVIMVAKRDVKIAKYNLVSIASVICTLLLCVIKIVEMELELKLRIVIMETRQDVKPTAK